LASPLRLRFKTHSSFTVRSPIIAEYSTGLSGGEITEQPPSAVTGIELQPYVTGLLSHTLTTEPSRSSRRHSLHAATGSNIHLIRQGSKCTPVDLYS